MYFADFDSLGAITYDLTDTDVIDSFGGTPTWFEFKVKGNSSFEQAVNSSRENGTTFFEQTLNLLSRSYLSRLTMSLSYLHTQDLTS